MLTYLIQCTYGPGKDYTALVCDDSLHRAVSTTRNSGHTLKMRHCQPIIEPVDILQLRKLVIPRVMAFTDDALLPYRKDIPDWHKTKDKRLPFGTLPPYNPSEA
jgi:hypothetical protein